MPRKAYTIFFLASFLICSWLVVICDSIGGPTFSISDLLVAPQTFLEPTSFFVVIWALALTGGILLHRRNKKLASILSYTSPIFGFAAVCAELLALHQGTLSLDSPEGEAVWIYVPRLGAATGMLALTFLGLSIQSMFGRTGT